jgi:flagellar basal-body rod modification protein FlgD
MEVSGSTSGTIQPASTDRSTLSQNFDQFLKLLTTQLQYQDPLSPMESSEFTNQLVQFSSVEQQIKTNEQISSLLQLQSLNMTALGVSFIGKNIEIESKKFETAGGANVPLGYELPEGATVGTVTVLDSNGNTVYSKAIDTSAGRHDFVWDGKDQSGQAVPAGKFEIRVAALTATNTSLNVKTYVPGHVDALESDADGTLLLNVDGQKVPLTDVRKILEAV